MILSFLLLRDFRNYAYLELPLEKGVTFFHGKNAQGKTNLLEGIHYLSALGSPRAEKESDLARWGKSAFSVAGLVKTSEGQEEIKIEVQTSPNVRKKISINGSPRKRSELLGIFPSVYFSPDDLYMVKKSSSMRRRFLDLLLAKKDREYSKEINGYTDTLSRRNQAIRKSLYSPSWGSVLDDLTFLLIEKGSRVLHKRMALLEEFAPLVKKMYGFISGNGCDVSYVSSLGVLPVGEEDIKTIYKKALAKTLKKEKEKGATLLGPHRDDLEITFGEKTFRYFGSQGEQRSVALALRMAESAAIEKVFGKKCALLLDDVLSELDEGRRKKVLSLQTFGHQIFITSTDPVEDLCKPCRSFLVRDQKVLPDECI